MFTKRNKLFFTFVLFFVVILVFSACNDNNGNLVNEETTEESLIYSDKGLAEIEVADQETETSMLY